MLYLKSTGMEEYIKVGNTINNFRYLDSKLNKFNSINKHEEPILLVFTSKRCKACKIYKKNLKKQVIPFLEKVKLDYRIFEIGDRVVKKKSPMRYTIKYNDYKKNINENVPFTVLLNKKKKLFLNIKEFLAQTE